jgi:hypothetical protein
MHIPGVSVVKALYEDKPVMVYAPDRRGSETVIQNLNKVGIFVGSDGLPVILLRFLSLRQKDFR